MLIIILLFLLILILLLSFLFLVFFKNDKNRYDLQNIYNEIVLIKNGQENSNNFIKKIYDDLNKK